MKRSDFFMPMRRNNTARAVSRSGDYFERMGMVAQVGSGLYTHLPGAFKLFANVKSKLNEHLLAAGCSEHQFPALQPLSIWKGSGRFEVFGDIMFNFRDQHGKDVCLAPTHEVLAALTAKQFIRSYRDMPVRISQIQTKFRDETRPRGGLMRTREFTMHDLYSFDTGPETAEVSYGLIRNAYERTLTDLRLPFVIKEQSDMGSIGGMGSHEFHVLSPSGEDVYVDPGSGREYKSIEVAHIFMLGNQYTSPVQAYFTDRDGRSKEIFMCSFGLGIERTVAAYIEHYLEDDKDLLWSWALAPYKVLVLGSESGAATDLYSHLNDAGYETMIEDRTELPFGKQLREALMLGFPIYVILGKQFVAEEKVEIRAPLLNKTLYVDYEDVVPKIEELRKAILDLELVKMSFDVLEVDIESRKVFVRLESLSQLETSFCRKVECGTDLMGNFGRRKNLQGNTYLKAGQYWVVPIMKYEGGEDEIRSYDDVTYAVASLDEPVNLARITAAMCQSVGNDSGTKLKVQ
jgi:prolyl-tRNA synthetase